MAVGADVCMSLSSSRLLGLGDIAQPPARSAAPVAAGSGWITPFSVSRASAARRGRRSAHPRGLSRYEWRPGRGKPPCVRFLVAAAGNRHRRRARHGVFLDRLPGFGIRRPACAAACSGVSLGSSFVLAMHRGSISPMRGRSPRDSACTPADPSANATSIRHTAAVSAASCQKKVGAMISGGKIDPSAGYSIVIASRSAIPVAGDGEGLAAEAFAGRSAIGESPLSERCCPASCPATSAATMPAMPTIRILAMSRFTATSGSSRG